MNSITVLSKSDSQHLVFVMHLATIETLLSSQVIRRLDEIQNFRVRFPPKPSRTHRVEKLGLADLAYAIALVTLGLTENY